MTAIPLPVRLCYGSPVGKSKQSLTTDSSEGQNEINENTATMGAGESVETRQGAGSGKWPSIPITPRPEPLIGPAPRSTMFFPLVVLVAILPGLVALNSWDLTPPGPLWGLRALAVLEGLTLDQAPAAAEIKPIGEAAAFQSLSYQPPLYAWLSALGMKLSADLDPLATVLPSYIAGTLIVVLVYLHGRIWRGGGMGLAAALLIGFNHNSPAQNAASDANHAGGGWRDGSLALLRLARACLRSPRQRSGLVQQSGRWQAVSASVSPSSPWRGSG